MQYTKLGRTGLSVSRLVLGTMNFGEYTLEPDAHAILDRALEHGINVVDTANMYGGAAGPGTTEEIIGRWFAQGGGRRERTVLATKLYNSMKGFGRTDNWPNTTLLSAMNIRQSCDASLKRLQTDHIDIYQMHHIDRETPFDEIWEAFSVLRQQGKVTYFGSSNFAGWNLVQAQESARRHGMLGLVVRAVALQPAAPDRRARGAARRARVRHRTDSLVAAVRAVCSAACCARRGRAAAPAR